MAGKGDKRRPSQVSTVVWDRNWDAIFNGKPNQTSMLEVGRLLDEKKLRKSEKNA